MGTISEKDRLQVEAARGAEVLRDIHEEEIDLSNGVIAVCCADGDQQEKREHLEELVGKAIGRKRVHILAVNGGALVLSPRSPLRTAAPLILGFLRDMAAGTKWRHLVWILAPFVYTVAFLLLRQDLPLLLNLWIACKMKQIYTIMLYVHAPCGAAALGRMDLLASF